MRLHIRPATTLDTREAAAVLGQGWRETYPGMFPDALIEERNSAAFLDALAQRWAEEISEGASYWLVVDADADGELVGLAHACPTRGENPPTLLELQLLYLLKKVQGSGVADALLQYAVGDADCCLWVVDANERAKRFYERHGFVWEGEEHVWQTAREKRYVRRTEQ